MYYVRIVFFISKDYNFDFENNTEYTLFCSGVATCKVKIDNRKIFKDLKVILTYGGFNDKKIAEREGNNLFFSLKKQFIKEGIPINISGGLGVLDTIDTSFYTGEITQFGLENIDFMFPQLANKPVENETLGMEIYELEQDISEVTFLCQDINITREITFPNIELEEYKENEKLTIAYSLLNTSNAINDLRASFLLKVSALESLVSDESYHDEPYCNVIKQINKLISTEMIRNNFDLSDNEMNKMVQGIKSSIGTLKKKSIAVKCIELIERCQLDKTYNKKNAISFFNECYKLRSEFVHTGTYNNDLNETQKIRKLEMYKTELNNLILDILEHYEKIII